MMHVNPVATDGYMTIGYDANGVAGSWPGDMAETCESDEFFQAHYDEVFFVEFESVDESYDLYRTESGDLVWRDGSCNWTPINEVLRKFGDI